MTFIAWKALECYVNYDGIQNDDYVKEIFGVKFPVFSKKDFKKLDAILSDVQTSMNHLVAKVLEISTKLLIEHSPTHLEEQIKLLYPCFNVWSNIGWYGGAALDTGVLTEPDKDAIVGIYGYKD